MCSNRWKGELSDEHTLVHWNILNWFCCYSLTWSGIPSDLWRLLDKNKDNWHYWVSFLILWTFSTSVTVILNLCITDKHFNTIKHCVPHQEEEDVLLFHSLSVKLFNDDVFKATDSREFGVSCKLIVIMFKFSVSHQQSFSRIHSHTHTHTQLSRKPETCTCRIHFCKLAVFFTAFCWCIAVSWYVTATWRSVK